MPGSEGLGGGGDQSMALMHALTLDAQVLDEAGGPRLVAHWTWAGGVFSAAQVRELGERWFQKLEELAALASDPKAGGHTPSDFALLKLSFEEVGLLESRCGDFVEVLPLSPLQEGLLFHALYDAGSDAYAVQVVAELAGSVDGKRLRAAFSELLKRHSNLGARFEHRDLSQPLQVITPSVEVPWREIDLRGEDEVSMRERLDL